MVAVIQALPDKESMKFTKASDKLGQREENKYLRRTWVFV